MQGVDRVDEGDNDGGVDSGVGVRVHAAGLNSMDKSKPLSYM